MHVHEFLDLVKITVLPGQIARQQELSLIEWTDYL